jgi:hypothetical protein
MVQATQLTWEALLMVSNLIWSAHRDGPNFPNVGKPFEVKATGEHLLIVSGSAFNTGTDKLIRVKVLVTSGASGPNHVGTLGVFVNGGGRHQDLVTSYCKIKLEKTTPGNAHVINLVRDADTDFNNDDWFNVILIESV